MPTSLPIELSEGREMNLALLIADLSGYTAFTETHGALQASEVVLRFQRLAAASLEPGVAIINSVGDDVFCAGADTLAVVRTALRLRDEVERQPEFLNIRTGVHRGRIVERERQLFGAPINLTARVAAFARGGQILCTEAIARAVHETADFGAREIGERRFRNVAYSVAVFELVPGYVSCAAECSRCRKASGSGHATNPFADAANFHWTEAESQKAHLAGS